MKKRQKLKFLTTSSKRGQSKGEITSQQIVILVVLIASFAILLFFLFRLNLGEETDKELCRNSVLLKGKSVFKDSTLLNCKKSYVCLTADGDCDSSELFNPEIVKVQTEEEIYRTLGDEMRDCWWMFGEGRVNYVGDDLTRNNYCSICSQVVFDDSVKTIFDGKSEINRETLYTFLGDNNVSGSGDSYLKYLYGFEEVDLIKEHLVNQGTDWGVINMESPNGYLITTGIKSEVGKLNWVVVAGSVGAVGTATVALALGIIAAVPSGGLSLVAAGAAITGVITSAVSGGVIGGALGAGVGGFVGFTIDGASDEADFLASTIISPEGFAGLDCEEVVTLS